jgi:hypothetical protein
MPITELNQMIHSFYFMEGREVRRPQEKAQLAGKFQRAMSLFGRR